MNVNIQPTASEEGCCSASDAAPRRVALTDLRRGQVGVVADSALDESETAFLRAMGLCVAAKVTLCRAGEPCIVSVASGCGCPGSSCRIGLARPLAAKIYVTVGGDHARV